MFTSVSAFTENLLTKSEQVAITIARPRDPSRPNVFIETLLTAAVAEEGLQLVINYADFPFNQIKAEQLLLDGKMVDVAWMPATTQRLKSLRYVPVPLYQGLHGNRLLLIAKGTQDKFNHVSTTNHLTKLIGITPKPWSDYDILTKNGLVIHGDLNYPASLKAVSDGLGDYFPRSALTIQGDIAAYPNLSFEIEQNLVLKYPIYTMFFLSNKKSEVLETLLTGFEKLLKNGEYERLFLQFYQNRIINLNLTKRRYLYLDNPEASQEAIDQQPLYFIKGIGKKAD
ncbi:MAG: hypothetical protein GJ680_03010 [Alteromonadaceae bacterium]|nr:hypothetical protein [Alteromonadaceae bacterium]